MDGKIDWDLLIECIKADPLSGWLKLFREALEFIDIRGAATEEEHVVAISVHALVLEAGAANLNPINLNVPALTGEADKDCLTMFNYMSNGLTFLQKESNQNKSKIIRGRFRASFTDVFCYEFSQGDLERLQSLINELRSSISISDDLDENHRARLLARLEKLQKELHKKISDLDGFWGLIGDAGVVAGKLGTDAKPLVDRIKEIAGIVWRTQSKAEELPSSARFPLLEEKEREED